MKHFKELFDAHLLRFILVGIFNTLVGTAIMFVLYNIGGCSYWVSSATNYIVGSILSYFLNKYFTFQNKTRSWQQIGRFIINIAGCYLLAYGIAKPLVGWMLTPFSISTQENAAMIMGMCLFTGFNYLGQRFFAFKE